MSTCTLKSPNDQSYFAAFTRKVMDARVPLDGSLELTHRCNLKCIHCYLGDQGAIRQHRAHELTTAEVKAIIDEVVAAGALNFTFSGGDPMVRKDFAEVYTYAIRKGLLVTVFCDGVLITDRIAETFDRYPPRKVEISIYGATQSTYEGITQVKGSFQRCLQGIQRLADHGHRFTLKTVLMTKNKHELESMRALAEHHGVEFYFDSAIFPCLPHGDNQGRSNAPSTTQNSVEVAPPSLDRPLTLRVDPGEAAQLRVESPGKREELVDFYVRTKDIPPSEFLYTCGAGLTTFHIDPYGNLQPCTISTNVRYNLRDGSFIDGWNGPVADIRKIRVSPQSTCKSCDKRAMCDGCPAMFFAEHGEGGKKSDYVCQTTHAVFEHIRKDVNAHVETSS